MAQDDQTPDRPRTAEEVNEANMQAMEERIAASDAAIAARDERTYSDLNSYQRAVVDLYILADVEGRLEHKLATDTNADLEHYVGFQRDMLATRRIDSLEEGLHRHQNMLQETCPEAYARITDERFSMLQENAPVSTWLSVTASVDWLANQGSRYEREMVENYRGLPLSQRDAAGFAGHILEEARTQADAYREGDFQQCVVDAIATADLSQINSMDDVDEYAAQQCLPSAQTEQGGGRHEGR